jgi:hypothetical protein
MIRVPGNLRPSLLVPRCGTTPITMLMFQLTLHQGKQIPIPVGQLEIG